MRARRALLVGGRIEVMIFKADFANEANTAKKPKIFAKMECGL